MSTQYHMRAYKTTATTGYVTWVVNDTPDILGTYSGYSSSALTNITVNKITESKTDNYLKSHNSADGYFLHLNSYDLLHPTPPGPPIPIPSHVVGLAIVRGSTDAVTPRDYSTLFWDEVNQQWKFAFNTNGDGYTVGASLSVGLNNIKLDGYIAIPSCLAQSGVLRVNANTNIIAFRNVANSADLSLLSTDNSDRAVHGNALLGGHIFNASASAIYDIQFNSVSQIHIGDSYIEYGSHAALSGFIRAPNNSIGAAARDSTNTIDVPIWSLDSLNVVQVGDSSAGIAINGNNVSIMAAAGSFAGGVGVIYIRNASTPPPDLPSNGGVLYVSAGALKYKGSSGTITTIAVA